MVEKGTGRLLGLLLLLLLAMGALARDGQVDRYINGDPNNLTGSPEGDDERGSGWEKIEGAREGAGSNNGDSDRGRPSDGGHNKGGTESPNGRPEQAGPNFPWSVGNPLGYRKMPDTL